MSTDGKGDIRFVALEQALNRLEQLQAFKEGRCNVLPSCEGVRHWADGATTEEEIRRALVDDTSKTIDSILNLHVR